MALLRSARSGLTMLLIVALVLVLGITLGGLAVYRFPSLNPFETQSKTSDDVVVKSIRLDQQVVLVSLGIQGIKSKEANSKIFGVDVPGSKRSLYLQYSYYAKLGIPGKDVQIEKIGDKKYRITIPKFIFIGHEDEKFKLAVEKNGLTSFMTPEVDTPELISEILSEKAKDQHVKDNDAVLKAQAQSFYTGILHGIDPELSAEFVFTES